MAVEWRMFSKPRTPWIQYLTAPPRIPVEHKIVLCPTEKFYFLTYPGKLLNWKKLTLAIFVTRKLYYIGAYP